MRNFLPAGLVALLLLVAGTALAVEGEAPPPPPPPDSAPPPPPPPGAAPPPPPPPAAGPQLIRTIGLDAVERLLQEDGMDITVETYNDGTPYLRAKRDGATLFVDVTDCADRNVYGHCGTIRIESGLTNGAVELKYLNAFNRQGFYSRAITYDGDQNRAALQWMIPLSTGVTADYILYVTHRFRDEASTFFETIARVETPVSTQGQAAQPNGTRRLPR